MGDSEHPPSSDSEFDPLLDALEIPGDSSPPSEPAEAAETLPFELDSVPPASESLEASLTPPPIHDPAPGPSEASPLASAAPVQGTPPLPRSAPAQGAQSPRPARSMPPPLPPQPAIPQRFLPQVVVQPVPRFMDMTPRTWGVAVVFGVVGALGGYAVHPFVAGAPLRRAQSATSEVSSAPSSKSPTLGSAEAEPVGPSTVLEPTPIPAAPPPVVEVAPALTLDTSPSGCIASHFPRGSFQTQPDFEYVCKGNNVWKLAEQMGRDVEAQGSGATAELWRGLGWYELATTAMLRNDCCESPDPLLPATPSGKCSDFDETLVALAGDPTPKSRRAHQDVLECMVRKAVPSPARFRHVDLDDAASAFVGFRN